MTDRADTCGAETRGGTPCELPAGWGTDHPGEGRCKHHGGAGGRPPEHGLYSETARKGLTDKIREAKEQPIGELTEEMAVVRALLGDYLERVDDVSGDAVKHVTTLASEVRRIADTVSKMDARTALTARHVEYLQARFADILTEYVPNEDVDAAIRDLRQSIETDESALDI